MRRLINTFPGRVAIWFGFAIVFYQSGQQFTTWLVAPKELAGGFDWVWVALFPVLLPLMFFVNRRFGCGGGACARSAQGRADRLPLGR